MLNNRSIAICALIGGVLLIAFLFFYTRSTSVQSALPPAPISSVTERYVGCIGKEDNEVIAECLNTLADEIYGVYPTQEITIELNALTQRQKDKWCHEVMHYMGWKAYETEQDIAQAFLNSSELCDSGMYHGVMEEFLRREGLSSDIETLVRTVCVESLASHPESSAGVLSLCYHGLGHGLMYITSSDLKRSLELCDALESQADAGTCYSGVFMEFNSSKDLGPLSNHRDLSDFSYCTELNEKHVEDCYFRQGLNNFSFTDGDVKSAMELCLRVPEEYHFGCFTGVGSNNPGPGKSHSVSAQSCAGAREVSEDAYKGCIAGSLGFVLQLEWGDIEKAHEFCSVIDEDFATYCYASTGDNINPWLTQGQTKEQRCRVLPEEVQSACIAGTEGI